VTEVSALLRARYRGDDAEVARLLAAGPDLDVFEAATFGRLDRLRELLAGDPECARSYSPDGFTALHLAAFFDQAETAGILLEAGADPEAVSRNSMLVQPLHSAVAARNVDAARLLLDAGADPDAAQQDGFTPLDAAVQNDDEAMEQLLRKYGAAARSTR
jgi:ankyrin repeat protein